MTDGSPTEARFSPSRHELQASLREPRSSPDLARVYAHAYEQLPIGIAIWQRDREGIVRFVTANRAARDLLAIDLDALAGKTTAEWLPQGFGPGLAAVLADVAAGHMGRRLAPPSGVQGSAEVMPYPDGSAALLLDDRGAPSRADPGRSAFGDDLATMLDHAPGSVLLTDTDLRIIRCNRAPPGITLERMVGMSVFDFVPPEQQEDARGLATRVLTSGQPAGIDVIGRYSKSWQRVQMGPVIRDGKIAGMVAISTDITAQKLAELEAERHLRELERSNADLAAFTNAVSHDLKAPLRTVAGFVQLLAKEYEGQLDERADEYIGFAVEGIARMRQMVDGLLEYARVGSRHATLRQVDLGAALDEATANLHAEIEQTGAKVTHDPLPTLLGDAIQIVQLFQNLVDNALKYRSEAPPRIHVRAERSREGDDADGWLISVTDNGIGVAPEHHSRIFKLFERLHPHQDRDGAGIGLSLCRRIVERHCGQIWVESKPGDGATFKLLLPEDAGVGQAERDA